MTDHATWCDGNGSTDCWDCGGEGGYHDCGDDTCACLHPENDTNCETCDGSGRIRCPACEAADKAACDAAADRHDAASY